MEPLGPAEGGVRKTQFAFRRAVAFAWAWFPDRFWRGGHAPLVLSVSLRRHDASPRWKEVAEPSPGRFMHHLELRDVGEIDGEVCQWLAEAYAEA